MSTGDLANALSGQLRMVGLAHERELRFHPTRRWRIDIAFPQQRLAVECDGYAARGAPGRHQRVTGIRADNEKLAELAIAGWRFIRVDGAQIRSGQALRWIERALGAA